VKKQVMYSDATLKNINKIKEIIDILNKRLVSEKNPDEIAIINERLLFMNEQLSNEEINYENDRPYFELGSYRYYKSKFQDCEISKIDAEFVFEIIYCMDNSKTKKLSIIQNIVTAYKEREKEFIKEFKDKRKTK